LETSTNKDGQLFLGLPASPSAAPSFPDHHLNLTEAETLINYLQLSDKFKSVFAGVMLWEATWSESNQENGQSYAQNVKDILNRVNKGSGTGPTPMPTYAATDFTPISTQITYIPTSTPGDGAYTTIIPTYTAADGIVTDFIPNVIYRLVAVTG
jgi:hypothetical protein